jgi:hypothetical protein
MPEVEFAILANHAEAHNGLLYLAGGGWTDANLAFPPEGPSAPLHFGIAVSVLVPWTETNRKHRLLVGIEHEDGGSPVVQFDGEIEVGRPPGAQHGADQRAVIAINSLTQFPRPGGYRLVVKVNNSKLRTVSFRVRNQQVPFTPPAQAAG